MDSALKQQKKMLNQYHQSRIKCLTFNRGTVNKAANNSFRIREHCHLRGTSGGTALKRRFLGMKKKNTNVDET